MAKVTLNLTEDHLKLITYLNYQYIDNDYCGLDKYSLYGGTFVMEDVALAIGKLDQAIEGTENDYNGRKFSKELEDYMWELHLYIWEHLELIESLVHQFIVRGGLTPGKYTCIDYEKIWTRVE